MVTRHWGALLGLVSLIGAGSLGIACGSSDDNTGTTGGTSGSAGSGTAGTATAGTAGTAGTGTAGTPSGGSAGSGGAAVDPSTCTTEATCASFKTPDATKAQPPAKPSDSPVNSTDVIQAVNQLFIGDTTRDGTTDKDAWKDYGFDIDGWSSTPAQGFHCSPQKNGKVKSIRVDGNGGIDNSFGANIVNDILAPLAPDPSSTVTDAIKGGSFSILLKMEKLGTTATTGTGVRTQLYAASGTKGADGKPVPPPADWSTYLWHPYAELVDAKTGDSKVIFPDAYVTNNTWVSGGQGEVTLQLSIAGQTLSLAIKKAQLDVLLSADHKTGSKGNIGGVLETEQLIASLKSIAGTLDPNLCGDSPTFEGIATKIRAASDILTDGTQDPAKMCDGISIGIGFNSQLSALGDKVEGAAATDPCATK